MLIHVCASVSVCLCVCLCVCLHSRDKTITKLARGIVLATHLILGQKVHVCLTMHLYVYLHNRGQGHKMHKPISVKGDLVAGVSCTL